MKSITEPCDLLATQGNVVDIIEKCLVLPLGILSVSNNRQQVRAHGCFHDQQLWFEMLKYIYFRDGLITFA